MEAEVICEVCVALAADQVSDVETLHAKGLKSGLETVVEPTDTDLDWLTGVMTCAVACEVAK